MQKQTDIFQFLRQQDLEERPEKAWPDTLQEHNNKGQAESIRQCFKARAPGSQFNEITKDGELGLHIRNYTKKSGMFMTLFVPYSMPMQEVWNLGHKFGCEYIEQESQQ